MSSPRNESENPFRLASSDPFASPAAAAAAAAGGGAGVGAG